MRINTLSTVMAMCISAAIMTALAIGILWVSDHTFDSMLASQTQSMDNMVQSTLKSIQDFTRQSGSLAKNLASQQAAVDALRGHPEQMARNLRNVLAQYGDFWAAFVFDRQGRVVAGANANGKDMAGADRSGRAYVQAIAGGEDFHLSDTIIQSKSGGGINIFAIAAAVKDADGQTIGGVGLFPIWDRFTAAYVDPYRIGENGYGFMLDKNGRFIAHPLDKSLLLKNLSNLDFIKKVMNLKNGDTVYKWKGRNKIMSFATMPETGWSVCMSAYEDDLAAAAIDQRNILAVGGLIMAGLLSAALVAMLRMLVLRPMTGILEFTNQIAAGDLQARLQGTFRFELAHLAKKIQAMVGELKTRLGFSDGVLKGLTLPCAIVGPDLKLIWTNRHACELLEKNQSPESYVGMRSGEFIWSDSGREPLCDRALREKRRLDAEIDYPTPSGTIRTLQTTATPFNDMDGNLLGSLVVWIDLSDIRHQQKMIAQQNERIAVAAQKADEIAHFLFSASEELSSQMEETSRNSDTQREQASETSTAMEQMNATVLEIARSAGAGASDADRALEKATRGEGIVNDVIGAIGDVHAKADELASSMEELEQQAGSIGSVMSVISDIADQTNLLALNAAIEAARAGEAGRGFAVVADEVRKLAEKTMNATKEVGQAISAMQNVTQINLRATESAAQSVTRSTELANNSGETLREIVSIIHTVADQSRNIAAAAEEQSAASEQISRATEAIHNASTESAEVIVQSSEAVQEIARMAASLNGITKDMLKHEPN